MTTKLNGIAVLFTIDDSEMNALVFSGTNFCS